MFKYTLSQEVQIESEDGTFKTFRWTTQKDNIKSLIDDAEDNLGRLQRRIEKEELV